MMDELEFLREDIINVDLFMALYLGIVATLFGLKAEAAEAKDVVEMKWRKFATIVCAIIAVLLLIRLTVTTVIYFALIITH